MILPFNILVYVWSEMFFFHIGEFFFMFTLPDTEDFYTARIRGILYKFVQI